MVNDRNGFNKLSRLVMLWNVHHHWPVGGKFVFNLYNHWVQLLLRHTGSPPVTILSQEEVTQAHPLSTVLYGITLVPVSEELQV